MATIKQRNYLTLKKKVEVIKMAGKNQGMAHRSLAEFFQYGRTQIAQILKNKDSIMALYESNASGSRIHSRKISRVSEYEEVNEALYKWYVLACSKNIFPGGPELIEKAKQIAGQLGKPNFKGSNGWFGKWKARYNMKQVTVCGESGDVQLNTVESWKERLPEIVSGYEKENIWNMDETGIFWRALPVKGFGEKGKVCKGGKKSKIRMTVALFVSASGVKEKPIVIGKAENPRCFKGINKSALPVTYFSQKKAWMTGDILENILGKLNSRLSCDNRSILLLLDNAGCHPEQLKTKFTNIKICFLPANTTSKLQPLDLGIIQNFKVHYRHLLLRYILSKIDQCDTASEVANSVSILVAIRWVAQAWDKVKQETVSKCFRQAGVLDSAMNVVSCDVEQDPFGDIDENENDDLQGIMDAIIPANSRCSLQEYLNGEDNLPICQEMDDDSWEERSMSQLGQTDIEQEQDDDSEDDSDNQLITSPKITNYKDAILALEDVQLFLENSGHVSTSMKHIGPAVDAVVSLRTASMRQQTVHDYFKAVQ